MADKFQRDQSFDAQFNSIPELLWYPYVGKRFGENGLRVMVYAHNIPIRAADYDEKKSEWAAKDTWATCVEEYTYCKGWWTNAFRYFIKGAVGLKSNYCEDSDALIIQRVDSFVEGIAYLNFIQDLVQSDKAMAYATPQQIELSKKVNREILKILDITHCICWGKPTYQYVCSMNGVKVISEKKFQQRGFSSCTIDVDEGKTLQCLRIFHPSMPGGFRPLSDSTHSIISTFLGAQATQ